jgi:hypothetical protein
MKCPICGSRVFEERFWSPKIRVINFENRHIITGKKNTRKKHYYCANGACGFRLYGQDEMKLKKEMKFLDEVE